MITSCFSADFANNSWFFWDFVEVNSIYFSARTEFSKTLIYWLLTTSSDNKNVKTIQSILYSHKFRFNHLLSGRYNQIVHSFLLDMSISHFVSEIKERQLSKAYVLCYVCRSVITILPEISSLMIWSCYVLCRGNETTHFFSADLLWWLNSMLIRSLDYLHTLDTVL